MRDRSNRDGADEGGSGDAELATERSDKAVSLRTEQGEEERLREAVEDLRLEILRYLDGLHSNESLARKRLREAALHKDTEERCGSLSRAEKKNSTTTNPTHSPTDAGGES